MRHLNKSNWTNKKVELSRKYPNLFKYTGLKTIDQSVTHFFTKLVRDTIDYRLANKIRRNDFMQLLIDMRQDSKEASKAGKLKILTAANQQ